MALDVALALALAVYLQFGRKMTFGLASSLAFGRGLALGCGERLLDWGRTSDLPRLFQGGVDDLDVEDAREGDLGTACLAKNS